MTITRFRSARPVAASLVLLAMSVAPVPFAPVALAAEVPGFERAVRMTAREQPVNLFLEELFGRVGVPVTVEESVVGTVNGDFDKSARAVFDDIAGSFQIALYHDGAVAHVYPVNATRRTVLYLPEGMGPRVVRSVEKMGLGDALNRVESDDLGVVVVGGERFREQVEELADAVTRRSGTRKAVARVVPRPVAAAEPGPAGGDVYRVFRLRYAWADDTTLVVGGQEVLVPGVASLLRALADPETLRDAPARTRRQLRRGLEGLRGHGLRAVGRADGEDGGGAVAESGGHAGGRAPLPSNARIVADSLQNAVIIRDHPERMAGYESLIESLDVEPRMIEIEATIIDLDTDRARELGVNLGLAGADGEALTNGGVAPGVGVDGDDRARESRGGVVSLILGDETRFLSRIRALETQGAARVVSKPHVITLANVEAVLDTTSTFFVRVEGQEEVDLFDVSVGTTLRVTPHVFEQGGRARIKLLVAIEDGATTDSLVDGIPVVRNSSINTQALIDGDQSLLIGGLVRESDGDTVSKVPLLGDIPGLGALFRSTAKSTTRVERLFLISPRLSVQDPVGPRHSAPILFGDEADIIASAPARTGGLDAAFARRDAFERPLAGRLSDGGRNVSLTPRGFEPPPANDAPWPDPPSVRAPDDAAADEEPWSTAPSPLDVGGGWQAVERTVPDAGGDDVAAPATAVRAIRRGTDRAMGTSPDDRSGAVSGDSFGVVGDDGWEDDWEDDWEDENRDDGDWQGVIR